MKADKTLNVLPLAWNSNESMEAIRKRGLLEEMVAQIGMLRSTPVTMLPEVAGVPKKRRSLRGLPVSRFCNKQKSYSWYW